jgi:alpha-beta hydrolase superfamily lysophospholipase
MSEIQDLENHDLQWDVDGIPVHATLTRAAGEGRRPGVIFVAGSGPTDRNWETPLLPGENGSGRLLAEAMARAGFVTLRYDKRASGPHVRENMARLMGKISMQSHVEELAGAVAVLAGRPDVDMGRLFCLTNSEGAMHALHYQIQTAEKRFAGLVLTGVPGHSMADTMRSQVVPQLQAMPDGEDLVRRYDAAVADLTAGHDLGPEPSLPEGVRNLFAALTSPANMPFAREFLPVDPAQLLRQVAEPLLVVIGKKDIQVNWQTDGPVLEAAAAGRDNVTFAFPDDANHVLKHEPAPRAELVPSQVASGYNAADRSLDPAALAAIERWLARQAAPPNS